MAEFTCNETNFSVPQFVSPRSDANAPRGLQTQGAAAACRENTTPIGDCRDHSHLSARRCNQHAFRFHPGAVSRDFIRHVLCFSRNVPPRSRTSGSSFYLYFHRVTRLQVSREFLLGSRGSGKLRVASSSSGNILQGLPLQICVRESGGGLR